MCWFRSRARWGAFAALFALALQLVLSFGHVHADQLVQPAAASVSHVSSANGTPPVPAHPDGLPDDFCAICSLINLAGTVVPSAAPALPVPVLSSRTPVVLAVTSAQIGRAHV
jgi:hypothetical protein